jgi:hypothetical protein
MKLWIGLGALALLVLAGLGAKRWLAPPALTAEALAARWAEPVPPPQGPLRVYHLGHSLVGRDMPALVAQVAAAMGVEGHGWDSQLGWGASLDQHRKGEVPGLAEENAHPRHRPAAEALASGDYNAVVLTEMVELRDAIRWHDSADALAHWARAAAAGNPAATVYLYETWHRLDDPAGWLARIDGDLDALWTRQVLAPAMAGDGAPVIRVIPAGQALAAVVRAMEAGQVPGLTAREDLFARTPDGAVDPIHLGDLGNTVVAMAHAAVLYQRPPVAPAAPRRADGAPATPLPPGAGQAIARVVWDAVRRYPASGIAAGTVSGP